MTATLSLDLTLEGAWGRLRKKCWGEGAVGVPEKEKLTRRSVRTRETCKK